MNSQTAFIALSVLMTIILVFIGNHTINKTFGNTKKTKTKKFILIAGLVGWLIYIYLIGKSGFLMNYDFPPRFALFLILPAFLFTGVFLYMNRNNTWIQNIPSSWLIYYQTFRIGVETVFVLALAEGLLNKEVTFEGYNMDIFVGITAPIIAFLVFKTKTLPQKVLLYWNYAGVLILVSVNLLFVTSIFFPQLYGSETPLLPLSFGSFPSVLVSGFLMPSAIFVHFLSILRLKKKN